MNLIDQLIKDNWLKSPRIIQAFKDVDRKDFVKEKDLASLNEALPIGHGQTISQPLVVAFMLELLDVQPDDNVLDIGSGSGWTTALLGKLCKKVTAIEIVPELKEFGENNASKYVNNAEFVCADGSKGYIENAPYDKILCSAEAKELPKELEEQVKDGGRIVIPIGSSIWLFIKGEESKEYPGFTFVPLV